MEKLLEWDKKNLLKKLILAAAIIVLICFLDTINVMYQISNFKSLDRLYNVAQSVYMVVNVGLLVAFVGVVLVSLDYYIYPKKRRVFMKLISLISFISAFIFFVPFSGIRMLSFLILPVNFYQFLSLLTFVSLIGAIISVILLFRGKEIMINGLVDFIKPIFLKVKDAVMSLFKKAKNIVSKHKKIFIGISCVLVVVASFFIVSHYFIKTSVDVFNGVELKYEGVSGDGTASIDTSSRVEDDQKIYNFLNSVSYKISESTNLENEQVITVSATVPNVLMEELKISVPELTKEFTVTGLSTIPQSKAEIPDIEKLEGILLTDLQKTYSSSNHSRTTEVVKTCYTTSPKSDSYSVKYGTFLNIYKVIDTYNYSFSDPRIEESFELKGYTGLSIDLDGKLESDFSKYSPSYSSSKSLDEAEMSAKKVGLECN